MPGFVGRIGFALALLIANVLPLPVNGADCSASGLATAPMFDQQDRIWKKWILKSTEVERLSTDGIYCATSADRVNWTVDRTPSISFAANSWDSGEIQNFDIAQHRSPEGMKYVLVYSASAERRADNCFSIGVAMSTDGRNFERLPSSRSPYSVAGLLFRPEAQLANGSHARRASMVDPRLTSLKGSLSLWYGQVGYDSSEKPVSACVVGADSADGLSWSKADDCKMSLSFRPGSCDDTKVKNTLLRYSIAYKEVSM
jgi:hypothetical protein